MRTIMILFHDLGVGGVQKKISDVVNYIYGKSHNSPSSRYRVIILLEKEKSYDLNIDLFIEKLIHIGCEIYYYDPKAGLNYSSLKIPYTVFVISKVLWAKPDTILAFMEPYAVSAILASIIGRLITGVKINIVIGYDNVASLFIKMFHGRRFRYLYWRLMISVFFRFADKIIVPSETSKIDLHQNFKLPLKKIVVNKNWVDNTDSRPRLSKKYDIIYVGRIDKVKNIGLFLSIVHNIKKKNRNVKACIVGWGDDIAKVASAIKRLRLSDSVEMAGSQKDVGRFYSLSKIFLLTSRFEGLPLVGLEAMSWGLPVVSLKYPGADEMVVNGTTGFICSTTKDVENKLTMLLRDERTRISMGLNAKDYVAKYHGRKNLTRFVDVLLQGESN